MQVSFANQSGTAYTISSVDSNTQVTLTANFTGATNAATAMGFVANPTFNCDGESRLRGYVFSSVASSSFQIQVSQDATNWDVAKALSADPGSAFSYSFDVNLIGQPFVRLVVTDGGAGSTIRILIYTVDDGSGPDVLGGASPSALLGTPTALANQPTNSNGTTAQALIPALAGRVVLPSGLNFFNGPTATVKHVVTLLSSGGTVIDQFVIAAQASYRYPETAAIQTLGGEGLNFKIDMPAGGNLNDVQVSGAGYRR